MPIIAVSSALDAASFALAMRRVDPSVAEMAGFDRPILHGLASFGCVAHALLAVLSDYDAGRFGQMDARFTAHVFPGETLRTEIWADGSFRARAVERDKIVIGNGYFSHRMAPKHG